MIQHGGGECFVFGRSQRVSADDAVFVNGIIGHSSLLEDCGGGLREGSHPGTDFIPAALAAAESIGGTGREFLWGLIVGYDAVSRIGAGAATSIVNRRFRPIGVMGPIGAAATVLGADDRRLAAALAIAVNASAGTTQGVFEGTMESYFQAGLAARNDLLAARLGLSGAITTAYALEGDFGSFRTYAEEAAEEDVMLTAAAALMSLPVDNPLFFSRSFRDLKIRSLTERIELVPSQDDVVTISIELRSGNTIRLEGGESNLLLPCHSAVRAKFLQRSTPFLSERSEAAARLVAMICRPCPTSSRLPKR